MSISMMLTAMIPPISIRINITEAPMNCQKNQAQIFIQLSASKMRLEFNYYYQCKLLIIGENIDNPLI